MQRDIIITKDGSHSISIPEMNVTYHSVHGAIGESQHVFIQQGLLEIFTTQNLSKIDVFEMGFGTGLNALLTLIEAQKNQKTIYYETIETNPITEAEAGSLNYCEELKIQDCQQYFSLLHASEWGKPTEIKTSFSFCKKKISLIEWQFDRHFDLVYFDAFAPTVQPELWTPSVFQKLFENMNPGGIIVTYSSKGDVRRAMLAAGFTVEKLPGAMGKREMLRGRRDRKLTP